MFDPQKDFSLPIGAFAERLLGEGIDFYTRESVADVQAMLIVFDKYLLENISITFENPDDIEGQKREYKKNFHFRNMHRDPADLKNELMNTVGDDADVAAEITAARQIVDAGLGVSANVPAFGMILGKRLSKQVVNACLQVQAGLRILAIDERLPGSEKIVTARIFDNDPPELNIVQGVLNSVHENYLQKTLTGQQPDETVIQAMPYARGVAQMAILNTKDVFARNGYEQAAGTIQSFAVEAPYTYQEYAQAYYDTLSPPSPKTGLQPTF